MGCAGAAVPVLAGDGEAVSAGAAGALQAIRSRMARSGRRRLIELFFVARYVGGFPFHYLVMPLDDIRVAS